jgi:signal transduction histidine kinase
MKVKSLVHDLLNSLTVIDGNLSFALKENDLDKIKERIEKAALANLKAVEICRSQLDNNKNILIDVKEFYLLSLKILQDLYPKIDITLEGYFAEKCLVDKIYFFRVNENIIKNSIEAGATKLIIICKENKISFIDNGTGITKESASAIAKHGTSKDSGHGIGLGSISSFCSEHNFRLKFGNNQEKDIFQSGLHIHILFDT